MRLVARQSVSSIPVAPTGMSDPLAVVLDGDTFTRSSATSASSLSELARPVGHARAHDEVAAGDVARAA